METTLIPAVVLMAALASLPTIPFVIVAP